MSHDHQRLIEARQRIIETTRNAEALTRVSKHANSNRRAAVLRFAERLSANTGIYFAVLGRGANYTARFRNGAIVGAVETMSNDGTVELDVTFSMGDRNTLIGCEIETATKLMKAQP